MIPPYLLIGMAFAILPGVAWTGHTPASRQSADDIIAALDAIGMKHLEAAQLMGLTLPHLSAQLAGREALNAWRLDALPREFHLALARIKDKRLGGVFVEPDLVDFLRAAARLGAKRMLKAVPDLRVRGRRTVELPLKKERSA